MILVFGATSGLGRSVLSDRYLQEKLCIQSLDIRYNTLVLDNIGNKLTELNIDISNYDFRNLAQS